MRLLFPAGLLKKSLNARYYSFLTVFIPSLLFAIHEPKLRDKDPSIRLSALSGIEKSYDKDAILSLIEALKDPLPYIQSEAMFLLEKIGKPAIPHLLKSMDNSNGTQKWRILHVLAKNKVRKIIPLLKQNIKTAQDHNDEMLLYTSFYALGFVGREEEAAFILNNSNHKMALMALHKIAKTDLRAFLKGVYLADKFYEDPENLIKDVIKNLEFTSQTLMSLLSENHPAYQAGALFILRNISAKGTAAFFENGLYSGYPAVQAQALQGIDKNHMHRFFPKILSFIQSESPEIVQKIAIKTIFANMDQLTPKERAYLKSDKISENLMAKLNDKSTTVATQRVALDALFQSKYEKLPDILISKLKNKETPFLLQIKSIELLGLLAPPKAEEILFSLPDQPETEKIVLKALFQLKSKKLPDILISKLKNKTTSNSIKIKSIKLLGLLADPKTDELLFSFLSQPPFTYDALEALYNLKPPYIETLMMSYLSHSDPVIKILAIRALGKLKSKKSVAFLISNLSSEFVNVTNAALHSLKLIGDKKAATPIMLILASSRNHRTIKLALSALARLKDASSIPYLIPFLEHENLSVRKSAAIALKKLKAENMEISVHKN